MDGIHKLPYLLGGFMAVFVGIISYICGSDSQMIYIRMAVIMVVFYIVGSIIRNTLNTIQDELKSKKEQESLEEQLAEESGKNDASRNASRPVEAIEHRVDLIADDSNDEFLPMTVSRIIASKLNE